MWLNLVFILTPSYIEMLTYIHSDKNNNKINICFTHEVIVDLHVYVLFIKINKIESS